MSCVPWTGCSLLTGLSRETGWVVSAISLMPLFACPRSPDAPPWPLDPRRVTGEVGIAVETLGIMGAFPARAGSHRPMQALTFPGIHFCWGFLFFLESTYRVVVCWVPQPRAFPRGSGALYCLMHRTLVSGPIPRMSHEHSSDSPNEILSCLAWPLHMSSALWSGDSGWACFH